jgi:hypothetical protein
LGHFWNGDYLVFVVNHVSISIYAAPTNERKNMDTKEAGAETHLRVSTFNQSIFIKTVSAMKS